MKVTMQPMWWHILRALHSCQHLRYRPTLHQLSCKLREQSIEIDPGDLRNRLTNMRTRNLVNYKSVGHRKDTRRRGVTYSFGITTKGKAILSHEPTQDSYSYRYTEESV